MARKIAHPHPYTDWHFLVPCISQDECVVLTNYTGRPDHLFMGVFDGHGIVGEGDLAARKAQELLPKVLEGALASGLGTGGIGVACEQAFEATSAQMCRELLRESGCTAISAVLRGAELSVANCGDTRAVLGKQGPGRSRIVAAPLSLDHKAFRKDERQRILRDYPNTEVGPLKRQANIRRTWRAATPAPIAVFDRAEV